MPCLLGVLALFVPRLVVVLLFFFASWFFAGINLLWIILGFIFAPTTLLWVGVVLNYLGGTWGLVAVVGLVIALLIDFSPAASRREV